MAEPGCELKKHSSQTLLPWKTSALLRDKEKVNILGIRMQHYMGSACPRWRLFRVTVKQVEREQQWTRYGFFKLIFIFAINLKNKI